MVVEWGLVMVLWDFMIPSGNEHNYEKSALIMGKLTHFLWPSSMAMSNYQRVIF